MGQYHLTVNLDKKEFLHPHIFGDGMKFSEQAGYKPGGIRDALGLLLATGLNSEAEPFLGRWAGDRVALVGDYSRPDDIPDIDASRVYSDCRNSDAYVDISEDLLPLMERCFNCFYIGDGWRRRIAFDQIQGCVGLGREGLEFQPTAPESGLTAFPAPGGPQFRIPLDQVREALAALYRANRHRLYSPKPLTLAELGLSIPSHQEVAR